MLVGDPVAGMREVATEVVATEVPCLAWAWRCCLRLCMECGDPKVVSTKDTVPRLPGGKNCSAAMTGVSPVREVDSRIGRATASVLAFPPSWSCLASHSNQYLFKKHKKNLDCALRRWPLPLE